MTLESKRKTKPTPKQWLSGQQVRDTSASAVVAFFWTAAPRTGSGHEGSVD